jgi:hypothetical protein
MVSFTRQRLLVAVVTTAMFASGCATYRTDSNVTIDENKALPESSKVLISEDSLPGRKYKVLGPIEVSVKKLTVFHADPTKAQANDALIASARSLGADGVISVTYKSGIGFTTWGYIDASGIGVKFIDKQL